jgi:hypothetical protein
MVLVILDPIIEHFSNIVGDIIMAGLKPLLYHYRLWCSFSHEDTPPMAAKLAL